MNRRSSLFCLCSLWLTAVIAGCGGAGRYVPTTNTARQALETALKTWQSGTMHGPITSSKPEIHVFDARWQAGKKLESFEITEEIAGQDQPQFKVKLQLAGQPEETLTYLVIGIDPLNIFRDADYERATGM